ncbi:serine/threonine protein phosphatase [Shewanella maritima]|uniref:serine/threonine protein phosphatase n=1 Tax=Shewanella maritima TaxID=2520507 RepID=UPI003735C63B
MYSYPTGLEPLSFQQLVQHTLMLNQNNRICSFEFNGQRYWIKQAERLTGAMRLLKQNSSAALVKETNVLLKLNELGAPVPKVAQVGDNYLVIEDAGCTINQLQHQVEPEHFQQIINDASMALAKLHDMDLAHGRPALRDISWQQGQVRFFDFEAHQQGEQLTQHKIRDLLVFIHSLYRYMGPQCQMIDSAIKQYRHAGGEHIWQMTKQYITRWQWLSYPLAPLMPIAGKDLKPVYWVLKHFK